MVWDFLKSKRPDWRTIWREAVEDYAGDINAFIARGIAEGWDGLIEPEPPKLTADIASKVLAALRVSNATQPVQHLMESVPPSHSGLMPLLEAKAQSLIGALLLDDGRIILRAGSPYEAGLVWELSGEQAQPLEGLIYVGASPDKRYFVEARDDGFTITDGWRGAPVTRLDWPDPARLIDVAEDVTFKIIGPPFAINQLIVFPDGKRLLLVSTDGIYVLTETGAHVLYPCAEEIEENVHDDRADGITPLVFQLGIDMPYGAIAGDGRFFTAGHQFSPELIFDTQTLEVVGRVASFSEYPHHAFFTPDGEYMFSNTCHFYNGHSVCVPTRLLSPDKTLEATNEENPNAEGISQFDEGARIYAATAYGDTFYYGDAGGYLHARRVDGTHLWRRFVGSSFSSLDISKDGKRLIAATYAGFLVEYALDGSEPRRFEIGIVGSPREIRRWLVWKDEPKPLLWH